MYPLLSEYFVKEKCNYMYYNYYGCHSNLIINRFSANGMQIDFLARKLENALQTFPVLHVHVHVQCTMHCRFCVLSVDPCYVAFSQQR